MFQCHQLVYCSTSTFFGVQRALSLVVKCLCSMVVKCPVLYVSDGMLSCDDLWGQK